jgi:cyclic pyranopterin phosphate synthase
MIYIYTDGSCLGNPGFGGWASIVNNRGAETVLAGTESDTTNNRMELMAAIKGLEALETNEEVTVISDSRYLVNTMSKGWKRKANQDLWAALDILTRKRATYWQWVQGHSGDVNNERVDKIANDIAKQGQIVGTADSNNQEVNVLSHLDEEGKAVMVDVGEKAATERVAVARGKVVMGADTFRTISSGTTKKGNIVGVAKLAGINAAKHTWELIPLCHNIPLSHIDVTVDYDEGSYCMRITATVRSTGKTGVEMEALTAVTVAGLTIYDMVKAVDHGVELTEICLVSKTGGKSGSWIRSDHHP